MGNTNFQTIHQMGTAISNMVKQATGRDDVQNIDMEHITVAQNHHYEDVDLSGQVVSFQAGEAGLPFEKLDVQIMPVQDLHGYDSPWPAGGGKNLINASLYNLPKTITSQTTIVNYETSEQTTWTVATKVTNNSDVVGRVNIILYNEGAVVRQTYTSIPVGATNAVISATVDGRSYTFTKISLAISGNASGYSITVSDIQISKGDAVSVISPYSNICPITGWTMVNVYQAGENMEDARVYRVTFPSEAGIVYGGTLDVMNGELTVDMANIASYNGETLPGKWISDRDVYAEGTTPTTGAQVVYHLATPITYQLAPQEITTLLGQNYIWADTGDIEVKFTNVKEMY